MQGLIRNILLVILVAQGSHVKVHGGEAVDCESQRPELDECLKSMASSISREFLNANLTNFVNPTAPEKKRMEEIATEKLCNSADKAYVDCTIRILRACPVLIDGPEMTSRPMASDIRRLQWFTYNTADDLCVCYRAQSCLQEVNTVLKSRMGGFVTGSFPNNSPSSVIFDNTHELLGFGISLCSVKEDVACALSAVRKASCQSFLTSATAQLLHVHDSSRGLQHFLTSQCTPQFQTDISRSGACIYEHIQETSGCDDNSSTINGTTVKATSSVCKGYSRFNACMGRLVGTQCQPRWGRYVEDLLGTITAFKPECDVPLSNGSISSATSYLLCPTMFTFTSFLARKLMHT